MTVDSAAMLAIARQAAAIGAGLMTTGERGAVQRKSDRDFVTDLDLRIEGAVRSHLEKETPDIGFLGEEEHGTHPALDSGEAIWVLDPIDGTSNFIHGLPLSAISLALVEKRSPTVGVIIAPFLGLDYHATTGLGAFANGRPMTCARPSSLSESIVAFGDYAVGTDADRKNRRRVALTAALAASTERVRMFGSAALDLAWVAEGRIDACVILSNKPWDTSAGVLIARESGALVTDSRGLDHTLESVDTIAAAPTVQTELLALIRGSDRRVISGED
ncbi:inositol monophosphatase family protein [Nocardia inohanensis]|uniref:inositol monophosphatase family protein n=1 Tax=Nocardia inohanensis TaxID=209246 RepID=UPI000AC09214|nr:inositol monophosphatase family protein [Nocardia inohanensis]